MSSSGQSGRRSLHFLAPSARKALLSSGTVMHWAKSLSGWIITVRASIAT